MYITDIDQWQKINDNDQHVVNEVEHMGIKQRWIVFYSNAANYRAKNNY